ncbi:MAG: hypothetical protein Q4E09_03580 [Eubacteriales bacterium]|nr:hypothetical protein [Eubacteriales bacterium]
MFAQVSLLLERNVCLQVQPDKIMVIIFGLALPLVLIIITWLYLARIKRNEMNGEALLEALEHDLASLKGQDTANGERIATVIAARKEEKLGLAWAKLQVGAKACYQDRWFPPLEQQINPDNLADAHEENSLTYTPAILVGALGGLSSVLLYIYLSTVSSIYFTGVALLPLIIGIPAALLLANAAMVGSRQREAKYAQLRQLLSNLVPVYNTQNGIALLVDEMLAHESKLADSITEFQSSAAKMANADFSEGICRSVREIMSQEIAPPIAVASNSLADLARNLDQRQMTGMENLAKEFSAQLNQDLLSYLEPLHQELTGLNRLMGRTKDFVEASIDTLEASRGQNQALNRDISESLKLMTMAKNDLANEMSSIADDVQVLSDTTNKMAKAFAGEEDVLSDRIRDLSQVTKEALGVYSSGLQNAANSLKMAGELKAEQAEQHEEISIQLSKLITQLEEIDASLRSSASNFTQESNTYVNRTLQSFDEGLADVVERLIFTASALRDAVDALPEAIRHFK